MCKALVRRTTTLMANGRPILDDKFFELLFKTSTDPPHAA